MSEETGFLAILAALVGHEVEFVLIGGLAVGHHGHPRATKDVDVVPAPDPTNLERLWAALIELAAQPSAVGDFRPDELAAPVSLDSLVRGGNWELSTRDGRLDILQYREGAIESVDDYMRLRAGAVRGTYDFGDVWVVGYDDLIDLSHSPGEIRTWPASARSARRTRTPGPEGPRFAVGSSCARVALSPLV